MVELALHIHSVPAYVYVADDNIGIFILSYGGRSIPCSAHSRVPGLASSPTRSLLRPCDLPVQIRSYRGTFNDVICKH